MPRIFQKKTKKALNPYGFINENLAFPLREGLIVVLTRQSKEEYYGNVSTEIQTEDMVEHAKELVANPDRQVLLIDENLQGDGTVKSVSGTWGVDKRKGLAQLYEAMANGYQGQRVVLVLSFAEDRMFRDDTALEVNNYIQIALTYSVQTKIYQSGKIYNFKNSWDKKEFRAKCEWAADELNVKILGRMLGARERMLERGEYSGLGCLALGLVRCNDKLDEEGKPNKYYRKPVPYPAQAEIVKRLFMRYYDTGHIRQVYDQDVRGRYIFPPLDPGIPDFYGPDFSEKGAMLGIVGLRSVLTNPMYIGWWYDRINGVWLKDNHPAIVEPSVFWYAFNRLSPTKLDGSPNPEHIRTRERYVDRRDDRLGMLMGHLYTTREDSRVYTKYHKGRNLYEIYEGNNPDTRRTTLSLPCKELDALFTDLLATKLKEDDALKHFREYEKKLLEDTNSRVTARQVTINGVVAQMQELERKLEIITRPKLLEKLNADYAKLEAQLEELNNQPIDQPNGKQRKRYNYYTTLERVAPHVKKLSVKSRMILVEATCEVYIEPLSRAFYKLIVDWYAWGREVYLVQRVHGSSPLFSDEENDIIQRTYSTHSPEEIVALLPSKSWSAIRHRANVMEVKREAYTHYKDKRIYKYSQEDIAVMEKYGATPEDKLMDITANDTLVSRS